MAPAHQGWWRRALVAVATTLLLLTSACGGSRSGHASAGASTGASTGAPTGASAPATTCAPLPPSDVPPIEKALTERDTGTYCATPGTSILLVLKAVDLDPAHAWARPTLHGPAGGAHAVAPPLTAVRGTTVAAVVLTAPGTYRLSSSAGARRWTASVEVTAGP